MMTIEIEGKEYEIKNVIDEITFDDYSKILKVYLKEDGLFQKLFEIIEITSNIPEDILDTIDEEEFSKFDLSYLEDINKYLKSENIPKTITIDDVKYGYDVDENVSMRQTIDINYYRFESNNGLEDLVYIAAIIMRPITKEDGDYYEIEKYSHRKMLERAKKFRNIKAIELYPIVNFFLGG